MFRADRAIQTKASEYEQVKLTNRMGIVCSGASVEFDMNMFGSLHARERSNPLWVMLH